MTEFPSAEWFREFADTLEADEAFQTAMRHFDGAIRFKVGDEVLWVKIYRGQILEVANQEAEFGSTFTVAAPPEEWRRLMTEERNPFGEQQTLGNVLISGNALEATRMSDGLNILVDHLRDYTSDDPTLATGGESA